MATFILRRIPEALWARVKAKAAQDHTPIKALILRLLLRWLDE